VSTDPDADSLVAAFAESLAESADPRGDVLDFFRELRAELDAGAGAPNDDEAAGFALPPNTLSTVALLATTCGVDVGCAALAAIESAGRYGVRAARRPAG
jgi:hypothetical protein